MINYWVYELIFIVVFAKTLIFRLRPLTNSSILLFFFFRIWRKPKEIIRKNIRIKEKLKIFNLINKSTDIVSTTQERYSIVSSGCGISFGKVELKE